jgi:hypothetical protein
MKDFRKWLTAIPFCMALVAPVVLPAAGYGRDDGAHRYYDGEYKDYHNWNSAEQRYWSNYWTTERRPYVSWNRANEAQRKAYWRWRHQQERHQQEHRSGYR